MQGLRVVLWELSCSFVALLGVASPHSLALFSCADHDVCVPRRSAFEQDVERGNTDGLGDCQSKQAFFHSYLSSSTLPPPTTSLFSVDSVPLISGVTVSFFAAVTFLGPVCSTLTIHPFRLIHPSVPLGTHPPLSFPPLLLWPPGQSTVVSSWAKTGPFLTNRLKNTPQTVSCTQGRYLTCEPSEGSFRNSKQSLLSSNLWSLESSFFTPQCRERHIKCDHFMPRWFW